MADHPAPLRPLQDASDAIRRLDEYETLEDLASAVATVAAAVERSLRLRLRSDPDTPDAQRLAALSPDALPYDDLIRALRARDLVSIEGAGAVHELRAAAGRAESGAVRPADADVARAAVDRLTAEFRDAAAPAAPEDPPARPEGPPAEEFEPAAEKGRDLRSLVADRPRWMAGLAAAIAVVFVLLLAWALLRGGNQEYEAAVTAFRAGRLDSAAAAFERVRADRPDDVSTLLYLGRIYRRLGRPQEAAEVLRHAVGLAPDDPDARREMGHLFMDLGEPRSAARQYERALEQEPGEPLNWAALIRALRVDGDPRAEQLLEEAPPEVQAALGAGP